MSFQIQSSGIIGVPIGPWVLHHVYKFALHWQQVHFPGENMKRIAGGGEGQILSLPE